MRLSLLLRPFPPFSVSPLQLSVSAKQTHTCSLLPAASPIVTRVASYPSLFASLDLRLRRPAMVLLLKMAAMPFWAAPLAAAPAIALKGGRERVDG